MKYTTFLCSMILLSACSNVVTYKDHSQKPVTEEKTVTEQARDFIQQTASLQYIDYANVIVDTAYIGVPSRRGAEHSQDNMAHIFLNDLRKHGHFDNIYCCKVINTNKETDFIWTDSIISGPVIGYASIKTK